MELKQINCENIEKIEILQGASCVRATFWERLKYLVFNEMKVTEYTITEIKKGIITIKKMKKVKTRMKRNE